jgi:hypothetical protein
MGKKYRISGRISLSNESTDATAGKSHRKIVLGIYPRAQNASGTWVIGIPVLSKTLVSNIPVTHTGWNEFDADFTITTAMINEYLQERGYQAIASTTLNNEDWRLGIVVSHEDYGENIGASFSMDCH